MRSSNLKSIKLLLIVIALPVVFYMLQLLSFIFIPLVFALIVAMLFLPLMRRLTKIKVPRIFRLFIVILIVGIFVSLINLVVQISSHELMLSGTDIFKEIEQTLLNTLISTEHLFGIERINGVSIGEQYLQKLNLGEKINSTADYLGSTILMTFTTIFFTLLLLAESFDFQKVLNAIEANEKTKVIRVFIRVQRNIITFVKVKFFLSLLTGTSFFLACYFFNVSFPLFWALMAFLLNFIPMIGSVIGVIILSTFATIEIDSNLSLFLFILLIAGVQFSFGNIIEPILMGKSFSINVITILIMLMFWGFVWGVPGMVLSVPITVFVQAVLEQIPRTKTIASLMSTKKL